MAASRAKRRVATASAAVLAGGLAFFALGQPRLGFVLYPPDEVAQVKNVHAYNGGPLCQGCHPDSDARVQGDRLTVCSRCHPFDGHRSHVVGVPQRSPAPSAVGLPLGENGTIVCDTCHDPHQDMRTVHGLRGPEDPNRLCVECHQRH